MLWSVCRLQLSIGIENYTYYMHRKLHIVPELLRATTCPQMKLCILLGVQLN